MKKIAALLIVVGVFGFSCSDDSSSVEIGAPEVVMVDSFQNDNLSQDLLFVDTIIVEENVVIFNVRYTGGCNEHGFRLFANRALLETFPPTAQAVLEHRANGDPCEEEITTTISFDLAPLIEHVRDRNVQADRFSMQVLRTFSTVDFGEVEVEL